MARSFRLIVLVLLPGLLLGANGVVAAEGVTSAEAEPLAARAIVDRYLATQDVRSELAFIKMTVSEPGLPLKERRFLVVHRLRPDGLRDYLLRMVRPQDVEGVSVLASEQAGGTYEQWVYLPATGKARKLGPGMKAGAFLGSNFSYEDLFREIPSIHDYERLPDTDLRGTACFHVRAREREGGQRTYAHRDLLIAKDTYDLLRIDFYDPGKKLIKTLSALDYRSAQVKGQTRRPRQAIMRTVGRDVFTDFTVVEGRIGETFPDEMFTPKFLESWKPADVSEFIFRYGITVTPQG